MNEALLSYLETNQNVLLKDWKERVASNISKNSIEPDVEYLKVIYEIVNYIYSQLYFLLRGGDAHTILPNDKSFLHGSSERRYLKLPSYLEIFLSAKEVFSRRLLTKSFKHKGFTLEDAASSFETINRNLHVLAQLYSKAFCTSCVQPLESLSEEIAHLNHLVANHKEKPCLRPTYEHWSRKVYQKIEQRFLSFGRKGLL